MKKFTQQLFAILFITAFVQLTYAQASVVMNEIYSRGTTTDPDWIELYNKTSAPIDISGYKIYDAGGQGGTKPKKELPAGTTIPAKGFYVVVTDGSGTSDFGLSSSGETVWFENASGTLIDSVTFLGHTATQSYARVPDGGTWQIVNTLTRGASNGGGTGVNDGLSVVSGFYVYQNFPNPFNPSTSISYSIPSRELVTVKIYDVAGRMVTELVNEQQDAGLHTVNFDAAKLSSGTYYYFVKSGSYTAAKKLLLLK